MKQFLIVANWKMNMPDELFDYAALPDAHRHVDVVLCPPAPFMERIFALRYALAMPHILGGAQDVSAHEDGAYTGEFSASMLASLGVKYALVGHSERRAYHNETDELVNRKACAALRHDISPIICVGETLAEREAGKAREVLRRQTCAAIAGISAADLERVVFAYEPVWAIGTGLAATPKDAAIGEEAIFDASDDISSAGCRILYGGSVTEENAEELLRVSGICGLLVGGKSLDSKAFAQIVGAAMKISDLERN